MPPARVRVIHWKPTEAAGLLESLRLAGCEPGYDGCGNTPEPGRAIRLNPPDIIVIGMSRPPGPGRSVAGWLRSSKALRDIPILFIILFIDVAEGKVDYLRGIIPDAVCLTSRSIKSALTKALRCHRIPAASAVPQPQRTTAQKPGIDQPGTVGVIDPPRSYLAALGELPHDTETGEEPERPARITLWFIHHPETFLGRLVPMSGMAATSRLWIIWRKGSTNGLTQLSSREAARETGLVDYKICSVSPEWSGMLVTWSKA